MKFFLIITLSLASLSAQTRIDLSSQSRNADFSLAGFTKPVRLAQTLPATCQEGEILLLMPSTELYSCTPAQTWRLTGAGNSGNGSDLATFEVRWQNSSTLALGDGCSTIRPCLVRLGTAIFRTTVSALATVSGTGSGIVHVYVNANGQLVVGAPETVTIECTGCAVDGAILDFPHDSLPLYRWSVANGTFVETEGEDLRATLSRQLIRAGSGLTSVETALSLELKVDPAVVPARRIVNGQLTFAEINAGACAVDQTMVATGAEPGESLAPAWPALAPGLFPLAWISATGELSVRLCNLSAGPIEPGSLNFSFMLLRSL